MGPMGVRSLSLASVALAFLTACGGSTTTSSPQNHAATPATGQSTAQFDMCAKVPLGDVQAHSPFTYALVTATPGGPALPGACIYDAANTNQSRGIGILLQVTPFASKALALASHHRHEQDEIARSTTPQAIPGLGDTASGAGMDEVGVQAVVGNRVIDANLKGEYPDVSDSSKIAAGAQLIKVIISRLP
jgi:hypothetical protein